jgi:hypothetical protein
MLEGARSVCHVQLTAVFDELVGLDAWLPGDTLRDGAKAAERKRCPR